MSTALSARDSRIAEWWFQDVLCYTGQLPKGTSMLVYMQSLMDVAAADGVLAEAERKWILGFASTCGLQEDLVDQLEKYLPGTGQEITNMFAETEMPYVKTSVYGLVFFAIRAASSDGQLHAKETAAIGAMAKKFGISDEKMAEIHALAVEDEKMRQKRSAVLYPRGLDVSVEAFENKFS